MKFRIGPKQGHFNFPWRNGLELIGHRLINQGSFGENNDGKMALTGMAT